MRQRRNTSRPESWLKRAIWMNLLKATGTNAGFEVTVKGVAEAELRKHFGDGSDIVFDTKPNGLTLNVKTEMKRSRPSSKALNKFDGRLIGVSQVKQSLEELFVKERGE